MSANYAYVKSLFAVSRTLFAEAKRDLSVYQKAETDAERDAKVRVLGATKRVRDAISDAVDVARTRCSKAADDYGTVRKAAANALRLHGADSIEYKAALKLRAEASEVQVQAGADYVAATHEASELYELAKDIDEVVNLVPGLPVVIDHNCPGCQYNTGCIHHPHVFGRFK